MFGTPGEVIAKLRPYEALGIDGFLYCAGFGLPMQEQKRSLRLFIDEVMPAFAERREPARPRMTAAGSRDPDPWTGRGFVDDLRPEIMAVRPGAGTVPSRRRAGRLRQRR